MYVCVCNALTERRVRGAIREASPATVAEVYAACGVAPRCGKCGPDIARLLDEHAADAPAPAPALALAAE